MGVYADFACTDWASSVREHRTPLWKQLLYVPLRPVLAARAERFISRAFRERVGAGTVFFTRGTPLEWRRRWGARGLRIGGGTILVQGTGTGWDVVSWAELGPKAIIATDLFEFPESWEQIARFVRDRYGVPVTFRQAALEEHAFLPSGSIDLCASDAVLEHCVDLDGVLREAYRLLRSGGRLYATYGPLWYAPGGDHFSGRGGMEHVYNHLLLDAADYRSYVSEHRAAVEDFQSGGRYIELDLFSRATTAQYLAAFRGAGFAVEEVILELSPTAFRFRAAFPHVARRLAERCSARCSPEDLLVGGNFVRLRRP